MNILTVKKGIICQQVNSCGVMGAGLALQIRNQWPIVFKEYVEARLLLGEVMVTDVAPGLVVASLCAQTGYGRDKRYTDYSALESCLQRIAVLCGSGGQYEGQPVYIPYKMGCGLGGGSWEEVVLPMIERILPTAIICRL